MSSTTAQASSRPAVRPFGWRDRIGYMFGDFGNDFTFIMGAFYLNAFYIAGMKMDPGLVGLMFLMARLLDAFTDVGMGQILDRSKPGPAGRFRPWILKGAVPVAVASILVYAMPWVFPDDAAMGGKVAWMWATYILWGSVTYTMINIPYGSMASVITQDPTQRSELSVFRSVGATLAALVISSVTPLVIFDGDELLVDRFPMLAIIYGVLAVACYLLCYTNTVERVKSEPKPKGESMGLGKLLGTLFSSRALMGLVGSAIMLLLASLFTGATAAFMWQLYFGNGEMQSIAQLVQFSPALVLALFVTPLGKRFGKKEVAVVGVTICAVLNIVMGFMNLSDSPWIYIAIFAVAGLGLGSFNILVWAFITDVIDYQEVKTYQRNDGTIYAVYSWARKFGQALAGGLGAASLGWIGYNAELGTNQSESTVQGIWLLSTTGPGIVYALCAVILAFIYPLNKARVNEDVRILEERRAAAEA